jgi:hypothetical protein
MRVALVLAGPETVLADAQPLSSTAFYRVEQVPLLTPRDTDGDGLEDIWELLHRHMGAALNASDADEDHTGNGIPDRWDCLRESLREGAARARPIIAAGEEHSVALKSDESLWAWGDNFEGEAGLGNITETNAPAPVGTNTQWRTISADGRHSFALREDGTLWSWRSNLYGQLGNGTRTSTNAPVRVGTDSNWMAVAVGSFHSIALKTDGTLWAWGNDYSGAAGFGSRISTNAPAQVGAARDWMAITAGASHTLAVKSDGTLWAWGDNSYGQVGQPAIWEPAPVLGSNWGTPRP